jgi:uncharacterized membrane protein YedE/YeeE
MDQRYWPWWVGSLALASVPVLHWLLLGRMFAVSGRFTSLTDRLRSRRIAPMALDDCAAPGAMPDAAETAVPKAQGPGTHVLFLVFLAVGGGMSASLRGAFLRPLSPGFVQVFGSSPAVLALVLFGGGVLVGFGTRMAGGCTSGHGLSGVSRMQPGSLLATAAFFGAGVAVSVMLGTGGAR